MQAEARSEKREKNPCQIIWDSVLHVKAANVVTSQDYKLILFFLTYTILNWISVISKQEY